MQMEIMVIQSWPGIRFGWSPSAPTARWTQLGLLGTGAAWLVYTRLYFFLHPRGLTIAPSLFMSCT
jgi:hypothetical protein